jgi:hypothetical protein
MELQVRPEQTKFEDLAELCSSPGYIHAIAHLCFRDNMIAYSDEMKSEDMQHLFSSTRLIRTETSTLIGLLIKNDIDYTLPSPSVMQQYIDKTETLLKEIHKSMSALLWKGFDPKEVQKFDPFDSGAALREPIFYGGESAYSFQYRDLSVRKYSKDEEWLRANKGFSIQEARDVVRAVGRFLDEKAVSVMEELRDMPPDQWTFLPTHTFTTTEIAEYAHIDFTTVNNVLSAFALPDGERNGQFCALSDFNVVNASPLIRVAKDEYVLFHIYSLAEALYDAPFYWMGADNVYVKAAMMHRGQFTEEFAAERLALVFGKDRVHENVDVFESKDKKIGEIDVLVLFGNRAIVVQAKSKRLTLESRKGNDGKIRDDFRKSVQDSYDQAYRCAKLLGNPKYIFKDRHSDEIDIRGSLKDVYIFCVVSDHYPALSFQARQFLKFELTKTIPPPFVLDVFTLDAMTEMLASPLQLLSYVDRRTKYSEKVMASHELTILSYHLKRNLWLGEEYDLVMLEDDISSDLDLAMLVRREDIPGPRTPDGILTRLGSTTLGRFVKEIEMRPDPSTIDLGYMLLTLSEKTVIEVSGAIDELARRARADGKNHDLTIGLGQGGTGFTVHCNNNPINIAGPALESHCHTRKYTEHAESWFGVCVRPSDTSLRFGLNLHYNWERNDEMDVSTKNMAKPDKLSNLLETTRPKKGKIGRNEPCPCGSGRKYKKCCLLREAD